MLCSYQAKSHTKNSTINKNYISCAHYKSNPWVHKRLATMLIFFFCNIEEISHFSAEKCLQSCGNFEPLNVHWKAHNRHWIFCWGKMSTFRALVRLFTYPDTSEIDKYRIKMRKLLKIVYLCECAELTKRCEFNILLTTWFYGFTLCPFIVLLSLSSFTMTMKR